MLTRRVLVDLPAVLSGALLCISGVAEMRRNVLPSGGTIDGV